MLQCFAILERCDPPERPAVAIKAAKRSPRPKEPKKAQVDPKGH